MAKKLNLDIIIPAFNEELNIHKLLRGLVKKHNYDKINNIYVISDNSTDDTHKIVEGMAKNNDKIKQVIKNKRRGKFDSLNRGFKISNADILIMFDSDILINKNSINGLINPLMKYKKIGLTTLKNNPIQSKKTYTSFASLFSSHLKNETIKSKRNYNYNNFYAVCGRAVAMKKEVFKQIKLKPGPGGDDQELFFLTLEKGYLTYYVENSNIDYFVPTNIVDYFKQNNRFINATQHRKKLHKKISIKYGPSSFNPIKTFILTFLKHPIEGITWAPLYLIGKVRNLLKKSKKTSANWEISKSTK
jgi:cellulose synthase/poly-beta-1,6-N-acetylglucosamine synthase-like glycosyltransferase